MSNAAPLSGYTFPAIKLAICVFFPPVGAYECRGLGRNFWVNVVLTMLGYIPGVIHSILLLAWAGELNHLAAGEHQQAGRNVAPETRTP